MDGVTMEHAGTIESQGTENVTVPVLPMEEGIVLEIERNPKEVAVVKFVHFGSFGARNGFQNYIVN